MIKKVSAFLKHDSIKRVAGNTISLSGLQFFQYFLPLVYLPYLIKILGPDKFGLIVLAETMVQYFILFTDYGFGLTATKEIAEHKGSASKVNEIFSSIFILKIILLIVSFFVLLVIVFCIPNFRLYWPVFLLYFGMVAGQSIFPVWFFQGIEKMKYTAIFNILPKIIFAALVFVLVKHKSDYIVIPILNSLGYLTSGLTSLLIALFYFKVKISLPRISVLKQHLFDGWHVFIGVLSSNFASLNITFLLGVMTTNTIVGYYTAINKFVQPISQLIRPLSTALFPYLSNLKKINIKKFHRIIKNVTVTSLVGYGLFAAVIFVFAKPIILMTYGKVFTPSILVLQLIIFYPIPNCVYYLYCIPNLILFNHKKIFSRILLIIFIISFALSFALIFWFQHAGAAASVTLISLITVVYMHMVIRKLNKLQTTISNENTQKTF